MTLRMVVQDLINIVAKASFFSGKDGYALNFKDLL